MAYQQWTVLGNTSPLLITLHIAQLATACNSSIHAVFLIGVTLEMSIFHEATQPEHSSSDLGHLGT